MDNQILQLVKIITALYFNDLAEDENPQLYEEVQDILKEVKVDPRAGGGFGGEDSVIEALRYTAEWMVYNKEGKYNRDDIVARLTINLQGNHDYIELAKTLIDPAIEPVEARKRVTSIMRELRYDKKRSRLRQMISKANAKLNFSGDYIEISDYVSSLMSELEDMRVNHSDAITGFVGKVDFTDDDEIEKALTKGIELTAENGTLYTGFQGITDACGGRGIPRGFMVNFGGLTHDYKSGILLDLSLNLPVFNDPWMWDPAKKPLILRVSFENTIDQDITNMYKKLYEIHHGIEYNDKDINIADARRFLKDYFQQRGYTFQIHHYDPAEFCIYDLFDLFNSYIEAGYEIHAVCCDYLGLIADKTSGERLDTKIQKTIEMTRNYCYPKGITFFNGHQMSTAAQELAKDNSATFTRRTCTGGWYMDCKSLHTKLDLEFVMHIHKHIDGRSYLMFSKGKHRGVVIPESKRHFMYRFEEIGGIVPDFGGESRALYALPKAIDEGETIDWD